MNVSVVLPTRNRAEHVHRAIASVLGQTVRELEVIVIDDASDDGTAAAVEGLAKADRRLRLIRHDEPRGAAGARNTGIEAAKGAVVAFLDDDCIWAATKLEKQLPRLAPDRGVVYSRQAIRYQGRWIVEGAPGAEHDALAALLRTNYVGTPSLLVRRELFRQVGGFDEALPRLQDWDLALRLARCTRFAYVPEILVKGWQGDQGISQDRDALVTAAERMVERHAAHLSRRQLAALHYGLAKFLLVDGRTPTARRFFLQALRLDPVSPVHWAGVTAGLLGPAPARAIRAWRRRGRASADDDAMTWLSANPGWRVGP